MKVKTMTEKKPKAKRKTKAKTKKKTTYKVNPDVETDTKSLVNSIAEDALKYQAVKAATGIEAEIVETKKAKIKNYRERKPALKERPVTLSELEKRVSDLENLVDRLIAQLGAQVGSL